MLSRKRKSVRSFRLILLTGVLVFSLPLFLLSGQTAQSQDKNLPNPDPGDLSLQQTSPDDAEISSAAEKSSKAVIIICADMVDEGMYESIVRRTESALADGATYIIYQIDTDGGRVDSAVKIWEYFMHEVTQKAHTVAYITTRAISAGALISVACQDIIMKKATQIGDCAPILLGGTLEGVEREKMESYIRARFKTAAEINGYPEALCQAMVTTQLKVYQVPVKNTDQFEYFEEEFLPETENEKYALDEKKLVVKEDQLLTLSAADARRYGLARTVVEGLQDQALEEALVFLEERDNVQFPRPAAVLETNWSEELVRWLTHPAVAGILLMVALLAIYVELNSPGLGLPGAVAVIAFAVLFGSKFLIGMANWWEIAIFTIGLGLLMVEFFVIPGFGVAGITGIMMIIFALGAMMVQNAPDEIPVPPSPVDWQMFQNQLLWSLAGVILFIVAAYLFGRYLPSIPVASRLVLATPVESAVIRSGGNPAPAPAPAVKVGQQGTSLSQLRPSGAARFGAHRLTVVSRGELIEAKTKIKVVAIDGNSIVVKEIADDNKYT